jgi:hypothetical protein
MLRRRSGSVQNPTASDNMLRRRSGSVQNPTASDNMLRRRSGSVQNPIASDNSMLRKRSGIVQNSTASDNMLRRRSGSVQNSTASDNSRLDGWRLVKVSTPQVSILKLVFCICAGANFDYWTGELVQYRRRLLIYCCWTGRCSGWSVCEQAQEVCRPVGVIALCQNSVCVRKYA